jgi:hypothetical protein
MVLPTDCKLYRKTKKYIYRKYPKHSAYRSGLLVKQYKKDFSNKYGTRKSPYTGKKSNTKKKGLSRWFAEKWRNQRGNVGYKYKNDIYRPTKRITSHTPKTFSDIGIDKLKKSRREKYRKGRVYKF